MIIALLLLSAVLFGISNILANSFDNVILLWFIGAFLICFLLVQFLNYQDWIAHLSSIVMFLLIVKLTADAQGVEAPAFFWLVMMPMVSFIFFKFSVTILWILVASVTAISFYLFPDYLIVYPYSGRGEWKIISFLFIIGFMSYILFQYLKMLRAHITQTDRINEELLEQTEELKAAQEEIRAQYEQINLQNKQVEVQKAKLEQLNDQLEREYHTAIIRSENLENLWLVLMDVSQWVELHQGIVEKVIPKLMRLISEKLSIDQVSYWDYKEFDDKASIRSIHTFNLKKQSFRFNNVVINSNECPSYFESLKANKSIIAHDAFAHEALQELNDYLIEYRFFSLLDIPVFTDQKLSGIICCEHNNPRVWQAEENIFIKSIADLITLCKKAQQRERYRALLIERQEHINKINENLEKTVQERTNALAYQNQQLMEFAFLNSHTIRGPLCRVMGIKNLIDMETNDDEKLKLFDLLQKSLEEMDQIIKNSAELLESGIIEEVYQSGKESFKFKEAISKLN